MILSIGAGLVLLALGGEGLVRGAVALAARLGMSPLLIGLTVVGFGTSTPELFTSLQAAFAGAPGIAVGNVVGSNIANILLILGVAALIAPVVVSPSAFRRDGLSLGLATLAAVIVVLIGVLTRGAGLALLFGLAVYLFAAYRLEMRAGRPEAAPADAPGVGLPVALLYAVGGIAMTVFGAGLLVGGATDLARMWGVPDTVIGLTLVAVGTSLPELVTSVIAALRGQGDLAFGNVVGSNIYNILGILGATALVKPIPVPAQIAQVDIWIMAGATLILVAVAVTGWRIRRWEGGLLLALYLGYVAWLAAGATGGA
ncbi:calcium/sodium antiporter [Tropicimonas sp. IMCC34011]|uniref:calcium/sodium antiporter n=1 Tax=Tropicimonas sp. IMCC34011 TaxID=2248759 RepID=UPI000E255A3A|nr:calcium/sodium antiporter [Tropicimonas sp. IMCC34011]